MASIKDVTKEFINVSACQDMRHDLKDLFAIKLD